MTIDFEKLNLAVNALAIFSSVKSDRGIRALMGLVKLPPAEEAARLWSEYYGALCERGCEENSAAYFAELALADENVFSRRTAAGESTAGIEKTVECELETLSMLASIKPSDLEKELKFDTSGFPKWHTRVGALPPAGKLKESVLKRGYGVFAQSIAYAYDEESQAIKPIENVSKIRLNDLKLYDDCKQIITDNTLAFLEGLPANNILLYGDRGTGKSSAVHAVLNEYKDNGLRLVEMPKSAISDFPKMLSLIEGMKCFRFVIFIDDLTFVEGTDDFSRLKAALEGSACSFKNALIYATSNRRHLLRERYEGRADELNVNDTMQEQMSLSDRFGLIVTFLSPDKREFIAILEGILADRGLKLNESELSLIAERYAMKKGGRSGRAAKQLADMIENRFRRGLSLNDMF